MSGAHTNLHPLEVAAVGDFLMSLLDADSLMERLKGDKSEITITVKYTDPVTGASQHRVFSDVKAFVLGTLDQSGNIDGWQLGYRDATFILSKELYYRSVAGAVGNTR